MKVITDFTTHPKEAVPTSVAIGGFDGLHLAHCKILKEAVADGERGLLPVVFTFDTSPETRFKGAPMLTTNRQRLDILRDMGIQQVYLLPFEALKNLTAEEFVEQILIGKCHARRVACGFNFHFGRGGKADAQTLRQLCAPFGVDVEIVPEVFLEGKTVSSTYIRQKIQEGDMEGAARFLGRPFCFLFPVEHGRKLGRRIGIPTVNQRIPDGFIQPKYGVYASVVRLENRRWYGITNVGVKPTVGSDYAVLETWIPEFSGDLYEKTVEVSLLKFIRPEQKFPGLEELRAQILRDRETAEQWIRKSSDLPLENLFQV